MHPSYIAIAVAFAYVVGMTVWNAVLHRQIMDRDLKDDLVQKKVEELTKTEGTVLPRAFVSAKQIVVVSEQDPPDDVKLLHGDIPVVWINSVSQRAFNHNNRIYWRDETVIGRHEIATALSVTPGNVVTFVAAFVAPGAHDFIHKMHLLGLDEEVVSDLMDLHPMFGEIIDLSTDSTLWRDGQRASGDQLIHTLAGYATASMQPVAHSDDNPFIDKRRPLQIEDN